MRCASCAFSYTYLVCIARPAWAGAVDGTTAGIEQRHGHRGQALERNSELRRRRLGGEEDVRADHGQLVCSLRATTLLDPACMAELNSQQRAIPPCPLDRRPKLGL